MRKLGGHQGGVRYLLQAHQQRLGGSPRREALPCEGEAQVQAVMITSLTCSEGAATSGLTDVLLVIPGRSSSRAGTMTHAKHAA